MTYHVGREPKSPTFTDYRLGRHYDWECAIHEHEHSIVDLGGKPLTFDERNKFVKEYVMSPRGRDSERVRACRVCAPQMMRAKERGEDPCGRTGLINYALRRLVKGDIMDLSEYAHSPGTV